MVDGHAKNAYQAMSMPLRNSVSISRHNIGVLNDVTRSHAYRCSLFELATSINGSGLVPRRYTEMSAQFRIQGVV